MYKMKRNIISLLAICLLATVNVQAQSVGYIHLDSVLNALPGYEAAMSAIAAERELYNSEVGDDMTSVDAKLQKVISPYNAQEDETLASVLSRMNTSDSLAVNMILAENALIESKKKTYSSMLLSKYNREVQPLLDNLDAALKKYAKSNNLDAIYKIETMAAQLAYLDERKIITNAIIALITK